MKKSADGVDTRPCVLVFAGLDPTGGAGLTADAQAIAGQGAHALTVCTALTVQDNDRVAGVQPVETELVLRQARTLADKMVISAIKIGITGSAENARAIADFIRQLRERGIWNGAGAGLHALPVVLDPVLASGHGDLLSRDDAVQALAPLLPLTTILTPNGPEAKALTGATQADAQGLALRALGCSNVLITGGHDHGGGGGRAGGGGGGAGGGARGSGDGGGGDSGSVGASDEVLNRWYGPAAPREWRWPRLDGAFHGSGCTLASAIAGQLALGLPTAVALEHAQHYVYHALRDAYAIAAGQRIPLR
jgi:hydroxymethylpyrimidine/phosphomethylpyrimidine kinase